MDKDSTCHDQQVFNDTVLYCLFKKPNTKDEFEDLTEIAQQEFSYDYPLKKKEETKTEDDWEKSCINFKSNQTAKKPINQIHLFQSVSVFSLSEYIYFTNSYFQILQ